MGLTAMAAPSLDTSRWGVLGPPRYHGGCRHPRTHVRTGSRRRGPAQVSRGDRGGTTEAARRDLGAGVGAAPADVYFLATTMVLIVAVTPSTTSTTTM